MVENGNLGVSIPEDRSFNLGHPWGLRIDIRLEVSMNKERSEFYMCSKCDYRLFKEKRVYTSEEVISILRKEPDECTQCGIGKMNLVGFWEWKN